MDTVHGSSTFILSLPEKHGKGRMCMFGGGNRKFSRSVSRVKRIWITKIKKVEQVNGMTNTWGE